MSHVQKVTKPTSYSAEAVQALMKTNALADSEKSYIVPVPGANDNSFLKEAKAVLTDHLDRVIANPDIDNSIIKRKLESVVDDKKWSEEQKSDVLFAAITAEVSLIRQKEFLTNFDKDKSASKA